MGIIGIMGVIGGAARLPSWLCGFVSRFSFFEKAAQAALYKQVNVGFLVGLFRNFLF